MYPFEFLINKLFDLKNDERIIPSLDLHNLKTYKLSEDFEKEYEDLRNIETKLKLHKYQEFIGIYLGPKSPYRGLLYYFY